VTQLDRAIASRAAIIHFLAGTKQIINMIYYENGSPETALSVDDLKTGVFTALANTGERQKVLVVPPDYTRLPSRSGELTEYCWNYLGDRITDILPALGTHTAMTDEQISHMFGQTPPDCSGSMTGATMS
jgi:hypothetical protein